MSERLSAIRSILARESLDAVVVRRLTDIRWAVGFTGSSALLIISEDAATLLTDGRYTSQAHTEVVGASIRIAESDLLADLAESPLLNGKRRVAFQADEFSFADTERLRSSLTESTWLPREGLLVEVRAHKTEGEIAAIRRAQSVTEEVFSEICSTIRPGITERELAAEVVYGHLRRGAERMSFDPIVAFGPHSALPHARPTNRTLSADDVILLDFGCVVDGYASDMTRTLAIGQVDPAFREVYEVVAEAQRSAVAAARAGMAARELDAVARDVISEAGYGDAFTHSLGHGIGLDTHEWPRVSRTAESPLPESAVVTIEPGIYLPERFGVRIEDMVVLHRDGCENLTAATRDLITL